MAKRRPSSSSPPASTSTNSHHHHLQQQQQQEPKSQKTKKKRPPPPPHQQPRRRTAAEDLPAIVSRLASATKLSLRFLLDNDHLLPPPQSLELDSTLLSAAHAIASLHSLLSSPSFPPHSSLPRPLPANDYWFRRFLSSDSDSLWLEAFCMSKPSFYLLLQTLTPSLHDSPSSTPPDHKLGAALFRLAHAASFSSVSSRFDLGGPDPACRAFYEVCRAVCDRLGHLFELNTDLKRVLEGFGWMSLPGCCGVLGFDRFLVEKKGGGKASVIVQVVVDSEGRFLDVSAGWGGTMRPAQILPRSKLFSCHAKELLGGNAAPSLETVEGGGCGSGASATPRYLLGGSCCPLLPWLLVPFPDPSTPDSRAFNDAHARAMEFVAKAFGGLRGRWRLLQTRWKAECIEALPFVIVMSCLLHNFLFKCSEPLPEDMGEADRQQRFSIFDGKGDGNGEKLRQALASQLWRRVSHLS